MTNEEMYEALVKRIDKMDGNLSATIKEVGNLSAKIDNVDGNLRTTINAMRSDLERQICEVSVTLETEVIPPLNTMSACYTSTYDKYVKGICRDRTAAVEIEQLKETAPDHSQRLQAAGL